MIPRHRIYMVAVGVNATRVGSVQPLGFAESDAFHFLDRVRERFPDTRVWMLLGGDATSHAIRKALSEATRKARAERDATLVFYFSGHGALIRQDVSGTFAFATHLLTCDAVFDKKCLRNALPLSGDGGLLPLLAEYAGKKLVLLDACHGGALPPSSAGRNPLAERIKGIPLCAEQPPEPVPLVSKANLPARCWGVTASQPGQHAYEGEAAGGGILTCALLEAASRSHLSAAASRKVSWPPAQQGPLIGVDEVPLRSIVEVATERIERMGVAQTPDLLERVWEPCGTAALGGASRPGGPTCRKDCTAEGGGATWPKRFSYTFLESPQDFLERIHGA